MDPSHEYFWICGGGTQKIYKTDLQGNILQELSYKGKDIEGICYDRRDASLWIVEERLRDVVHLDLRGKEIGRIHVNAPGKGNKGLEGITIDRDGNLWVINEKKPASLFEIDASGNPKKMYRMKYTDDISDAAYDINSDTFYILSDESACFFTWNTERGLIKKFFLPRDKFEGITVNSKTKTINIVNDADSSMLIYNY